MRLQHPTFLLLLACGCCLGCQSLPGGPGTANTRGRENPTEDPWVQSAGDIARTEHPAEEVRDPLGLRKYLTSEKAREIERNVGVGD
ncbi:hypothetical protein [Planctomicrobium piriforme]|uniref:Uncharacterized protein n=1 Tax=Planctomicrobium piriforme TaxID=1576369 RepID=A0A1I3ENP9_9PLAN|nr:hypothetical protein [Planctomicrobium piriforme]SFI00572.1 hypothetical protein SAMN05421753_104306 [Planctomicrobium piriforme]